MNGEFLDPSLWIYAIHSDNPEIIYLLEKNKVVPEDKTYEKCLEESIKCHHKDITNYILNNLMDDNIRKKCITSNYDANIIAHSFHYYNFEFLPDDFYSEYIFYYACQFDYFILVDHFMKNKQVDLKTTIIQIHLYLPNFRSLINIIKNN